MKSKAVDNALKYLGEDIKKARQRRKISTVRMAQATGISRTTLMKIEKGEGNVGIYHYANVLLVLGKLDKLADLANMQNDTADAILADQLLPKRISR